MRNWLGVIVFGVALGQAASALSQGAPSQDARVRRFTARFADGSWLDGKSLAGWHATDGKPELDGRPLLNADNPMLWLRDRNLVPGPPPKAFVEFTGGDCLPGQVVGHFGESAASFDPAPAHFVVRLDSPLRPPKPVEEPSIRVVASQVRRIVWQARLGREDFRAGTLFYRDGRSAAYRSARFVEGGVNVLLAEGPRKVSFSELAEFHFAAADPWDAYYGELASLGASESSRLLQIETTDGLVATATLDRFAAHVVGNPADPARWIHGLHPAWSLDLLWIPGNSIWARRVFTPHEPPLSRVAPLASAPSAAPAATAIRGHRTNRNEHGAPLRGGQHDFGWGYGVHAPSELAFPLPESVQGFRAFVGLDRSVGKGGCIWARVFANSSRDAPLYESGYLVGSDHTSDTGMISLTGRAGGQKTLVLQVDAAHDGRPEGADPLDIRDSTGWFDPVLTLDREKLQREVARRYARIFPAWAGWELRERASLGDESGPRGESDNSPNMQTGNYLDELAPSPGAFRTGVFAKSEPFSLVRELKIGPQDKWLVLAVHQQVNTGKKTQLEVRLDGAQSAEFTVPPRGKDQRTPAPLTVPLAAHRGRTLRVEIRQHPTGAASPVVWQGLRVVEHLPALRVLLDDEGTLTKLDRNAEGDAVFTPADKHLGTRSLKITPEGRFQLRFGAPLAIRERPEWGEFRYLQFAFRKVGKGRVCLELEPAQNGPKPLRYDAGNGEPAFGAATRVWTLDLPSEWIVITRDLYADFGKFEALALTLSAVDGEYALFDQICLARSQRDFEGLAALLMAQSAGPDLRHARAGRSIPTAFLEEGIGSRHLLDANARNGAARRAHLFFRIDSETFIEAESR